GARAVLQRGDDRRAGGRGARAGDEQRTEPVPQPAQPALHAARAGPRHRDDVLGGWPPDRHARERRDDGRRALARVEGLVAHAERRLLLQGVREWHREHRKGREGGLMDLRARERAPRLAVLILVALAALAPARAAASGRVQGKVIASESGEPVGFADLLLIPADTTMKRVGVLSNADGTFLLVAPAGRYSLQIRAMSYGRKLISDVVVEEGQLLPLSVTLTPEAIQQQEVLVEATAKQNTDAALLAQRRKAATVGDAVSAEQMRRAPDKNASDVLRRVTGLSVSDNKYVYVRGMGERYNSTEVDGVRVVSPEANKRVVPMDLFPAALLDNIVVQKAWSADRSGEFSGGDVQVHLKDFPGKRAWSVMAAQGSTSGTTFGNMLSYSSSSADVWGFGANSRGIPDIVGQIAGDKPLTLGQPPNGFP